MNCDKSRAPDHPSLVVTNKCGGRAKSRKVFILSELSTETGYRVHNNNIVNMEVAVKERVFYVKDGSGGFKPPPRPTPGVFQTRLAKFSALLRRLTVGSTRITEDEFLSYYTGRKLAIYTEAVKSLRLTSVTRKDALIRAFIKAEKICFLSKPGAIPRVIQPRSPRYNVCVGRYLRPLEARIYRAINKIWNDGKVVMKGLNAHQVGEIVHSKWRKYANPVCVGLDASRFDQHVSADALQWEHDQYINAFPKGQRAALIQLLFWQMNNKAVAWFRDGKLKYSCKGKRMSGDINTSLGNVLLMCAMMWAYVDSIGLKCSFLNNGDDCSLILEKEDLSKIKGLRAYFLGFGFNIVEEEPVYKIQHISFCQTFPMFDGRRWLMVRQLKSYAKDCVSLVPLDSEKALHKWIYAVGEGGLHLAGGIPIYSALYRLLRSNGKSSKMSEHPIFETGMRMLSKGMDRTTYVTLPEARHHFYLGTGITPDRQCAIEDQITKFQLVFDGNRLVERPIFSKFF